MRLLFVASLHHPQQLLRAIDDAPGEPPLFPPSMSQHHFEAAMRERKHEMAVFYRNLPGEGIAAIRRAGEERHTAGLTPGKIARGIANRLPARLNPNKRAQNARLLQQARRFRPDVIYLVGDNTIIYPETLKTLRDETGALVVYASGTSPIVFSHKIEREAARLYDLVLVNDFYHGIQWEELGTPRAETWPISAVNPDFHRPYPLTDDERKRYACDVAFVGTLLPDHLYSRRVAALETLRDFDLGIWSVHDVPQSLRGHVRGRALGEEMVRITAAAKVVGNIHGDFMRYGGKMRTFEAAGAGACQIADDLPGTRHWFTPGENILTFTDADDLREKVALALADDDLRARVAQNGRDHVLAHHTYAHRAAQFERWIEEIRA